MSARGWLTRPRSPIGIDDLSIPEMKGFGKLPHSAFHSVSAVSAGSAGAGGCRVSGACGDGFQRGARRDRGSTLANSLRPRRTRRFTPSLRSPLGSAQLQRLRAPRFIPYLAVSAGSAGGRRVLSDQSTRRRVSTRSSPRSRRLLWKNSLRPPTMSRVGLFTRPVTRLPVRRRLHVSPGSMLRSLSQIRGLQQR